MEPFHVADYITFAGLIALAAFVYTQIQGVKTSFSNDLDRVEKNLVGRVDRLEIKVNDVSTDLKAVAADVQILKLEKAMKDGEEKGYAKAKAELAATK